MGINDRLIYGERISLYSGIDLLRSGNFVDSDTWYILRNEIGIPGGICGLDVNGKIPSVHLPVSVMSFEGSWDASTNTPTLVDGMTGYDVGALFLCTVGGDVDFGNGVISFMSGDYVIYSNSLKWERIEGSRSLNNREYYSGVSINGNGNAVASGIYGETLGISGKLMGIDILTDVQCNLVMEIYRNGVGFVFNPISMIGSRQINYVLSTPEVISISDIMRVEVVNNDVAGWIMVRFRILKDV